MSKDLDRLLDRYRKGGLSRRDFLRAAAALGLSLGAAQSLVGLPAWAQGSGAPRRGGILRVAADPATTIDPVKLDSAGGIAIVQQVAEYLVWTEPDLSLRPVLATSWRPEPDARTWVFELRRGVRFHSGKEMTADDVVATFQRLVDPEVASPARGALPFLQKENIEKIGAYTVRFRLDRPVGDFPYYTQTYNAVILPAEYGGDFARNPVGTGPFRLTEYRPQERAVLERNDAYWDAPRPHLDGVRIALYQEATPQVLAMQAGEVDVILAPPYQEAQPLLSDPAVQVLSTSSGTHRQLTMRVDQRPFDDRRVREAVALCFDRPSLLQGLFGGIGDLGNDHPIAPVYPEHQPLPQRAQDHARARRLLAEAGFPDGFEIDLYTAQFLELPRYAVFVQQMLQPAGIRAKLHVEPLNLYYSHWTDVPFGLTDWTSRPTATQILGLAFRSGAEWNAAHWANDTFDRLLQELEGEPDKARRGELAGQIEELMNREVPAAITYFTENLRAVRKGVHGVAADMSYFLDLTRAWVEG
ncbi:ABC transporter substrate-binding protein [Limnochorda pilosa]|uniref:ABC transporter substrate-binding protein n=1 Tax=Limnochorda pilosa TaxID=1555112 RepID=UPI00082A901E|nr:ABC transporter substrate-binding protein [Limnochorda pilosa]